MRSINEIIVHCSATREGQHIPVETIKKWHTEGRGWTDIGYHFYIELDGTIKKGRDIDKTGAHCKGHNRNSIGICYCGGVALAKTLPPVEVTRLEYELKEEWNEKMIMQLKDQVEVLDETTDILKEEIKITSAMIQDGTEADAMLDELNYKLEELKNRKPKTTVIVKEVEVSKKRR
jgi:hypothetical protein